MNRDHTVKEVRAMIEQKRSTENTDGYLEFIMQL